MQFTQLAALLATAGAAMATPVQPAADLAARDLPAGVTFIASDAISATDNTKTKRGYVSDACIATCYSGYSSGMVSLFSDRRGNAKILIHYLPFSASGTAGMDRSAATPSALARISAGTSRLAVDALSMLASLICLLRGVGMVGEMITLRTVGLEVDCAAYHFSLSLRKGQSHARATCSFTLYLVSFITPTTYILDQRALVSANFVRY